MPNVTVVCRRCNRIIHGWEIEEGTSGFYRHNSRWGKYMDPNEDVVCDACMHADPRYRADYPDFRLPV